MLVRDIEQALLHAEQTGFGFGPISLSKSALVQLCRKLDHTKSYRLLELGGGQSTIFWSSLRQLKLLDIHVTTLEHERSLALELQSKAGKQGMKVLEQSLKRISDSDWNRIFDNPDKAQELWSEIGTQVPESEHAHYTIRNTFYAQAHQAELAPESIDVMIVDGPHGNGRSLAFPLLAAALKKEAWILIDDFDHYPFLEDLERVFLYEEHFREIQNDKRWVLVRLMGRVSQTDISNAATSPST